MLKTVNGYASVSVKTVEFNSWSVKHIPESADIIELDLMEIRHTISIMEKRDVLI